MTTKANPQPRNLIEALIASFRSSLGSPDGAAPPVALLWTDPDTQWRPILPSLRQAVPELYALGDFDPEARTGPVIWLRCIVDRTLPEVSPTPGVIPILYLPGVGRQILRAAGDCPRDLQPLIELQFRGAVWHQPNGRDWTVLAFLMSEQGLGLDIAQDSQTRDAMLRSLARLATEPADALRGHRLEAEHFDRLVIGEPTRDLLRWMSTPEDFRAQCDPNRWNTFREVCARQFALDPEQGGVAAAADSLLKGEGNWMEVWNRFCESPRLYRGVARLLKSAPAPNLFVDPARRPAINTQKEDELRRELERVAAMPHKDACDRILALEEEHKQRRAWVWAQLDESPYATALEPLARLARLAQAPLGGASIQAAADAYASDGWRCDRAAMDSLAAVSTPAQGAVVAKVIRALYEPWLDKSARHFQTLVVAVGDGGANLVTPVRGEKEVCTVFADGLRFDVAGLLQEKLEGRGLRTELKHRITPLPTVTATAKPAASPVRDACTGGSNADDFAPIITQSGQPATAPRLRDEMEKQGVETIDSDEFRIPSGTARGGWTETGKIDERGHQLGAQLVGQIDNQAEAIADRVASLLQAGWRSVRIVTDHGWLLLPGGLPKVELPAFLVETKWSRCAVVRGESSTDIPTYPWYWNPNIRIASPPGIGSFRASVEYSHGGVSAQECVVPELIVERGAESIRARIVAVRWRGMRCRVSAETNTPDVRADLRLNWKQPTTSIVAGMKGFDGGECSLAVPDDKHEGAAAAVVIIDSAGNVLDYKPTTVGEEV
jgi:hypothetical protein